MEIKVLQYQKGKIYIEYLSNVDDLNIYLDGILVYDPLRVTFVPDVIMTEQEGLNFLKDIREEIIENLEKLISKFNQIYQYFEIDYLDFYLTFQLEQREKKYKVAGEYVMILDFMLKEISPSEDNQ